MTDDFKIDMNLKNLGMRPRVGRVGPHAPSAEGEKIQKTLGDPPPPHARLEDLPERVRACFAYEGILRVLERKLNALTGERYRIMPAQGERVCIDDEGNVHVGSHFMEMYQYQEALVAGVLAHEWGHFPSRRKLPRNLQELTWAEIFRLRRHEETLADAFCGRALYLLGYPFQPLVQYLRAHDDPKDRSSKYHTVQSRVRVIIESYKSQSKRNKMAHNLQMPDAVYGDPIHTTRLIGS